MERMSLSERPVRSRWLLKGADSPLEAGGRGGCPLSAHIRTEHAAIPGGVHKGVLPGVLLKPKRMDISISPASCCLTKKKGCRRYKRNRTDKVLLFMVSDTISDVWTISCVFLIG